MGIPWIIPLLPLLPWAQVAASNPLASPCFFVCPAGEKVTTFDDHTLWHPDCNTNNIYITSQQDLIISYCKQSDGSDLGSINVSNILNGSCVARIKTKQAADRMALEDVTALFYNEERNEIYTGNKDGKVHVWSN